LQPHPLICFAIQIQYGHVVGNSQIALGILISVKILAKELWFLLKHL